MLQEATDSVTSVAIHEHLIVTGSVDGSTRTYDLRQGQLRSDLFDRQSSPTSRPYLHVPADMSAYMPGV